MMDLLRFSLVLSVCVIVSFADKVKYTDCGSTSGTVSYVDVSNCPEFPCEIKHNTNVTVQVQFASKTSSKKVTAVVYGVVLGVPVPFPLADPNACDLGIKCPLRKGDDNLYKAELFVKPEYPKVKVIVKWELKDDETNDLVCIEVPVAIVD